MKTLTMKLYRLTLLLFALVPVLVCAQKTSEQNSNPNRMVVRLSHPSQPARINLQTLGGNISVQGYSGDEVIIQGVGERAHPTNVPEEARGMRRLVQGPDLSADEDSNVVTIHTGLRPANLDLQVPAGCALSLKTLTGDIQVRGVR